MSRELDNTTNNDPRVGTRSTDTCRSAAHRFTHSRAYFARAKGTGGGPERKNFEPFLGGAMLHERTPIQRKEYPKEWDIAT